MGTEKIKKKDWVLAILCLQVAILLSSCTAFQVGGDITQGRADLLYGDPKVALTRFQRAAQTDPDYRLDYSIFPEGVWTYVGRAYYATGDLKQARQALERARREHPEDNLAGVYLGLVQLQNGDRGGGLKEIEAGLNGVAAWYDYVDVNHTDGAFWDPDRRLRSAIRKQLSVMAGRDVNAKELIENVAWLGREIEIEIDRAKVHRLRDWDRRHPEGDR